MASVYLARHVLIDRLSAIKFLRPDLGNDETARDRFLREARAVNRINHPNIVEITDYGEAEGLVYLVMEYVPGEALVRLLARGPLGWRRALHVGLQIASALGRAHEMGVIHRDLKPGNVILIPRRTGDDVVKLTDFGVAKVTGVPTITVTNIALGTPGYVAPEYREFGNLDGRSDLFALGVLLYESTCGVLPFAAPDVGVAFAAEPPQRLGARVAGVPQFFDEVVATLLARDPDDRPRDGFEVYDLLRRVLEREGLVVASLPPGPFEAAGLSARSDLASAPTPTPTTSATLRGMQALADERAAGGSEPAPRRGGPHLTTVAFDRIAALCVRALRKLDAWARSERAPPGPSFEAELAQSRRLVEMVAEISNLCGRDAEELEAVQARGRIVRTNLGRQLDEAAREHSKARGWAGTIAERNYLVQSRRESGEHSIPAVDAMMWEQAALQHEEERVRAQADDLSTRIRVINAELLRQNESLEHDTMVAAARLDGHIAALRSIALEAWMALSAAARRLGKDPDAMVDPPRE
jgi:serine/threonine-protein kinase